MTHETATQMRLRRAKDALVTSRAQAADARQRLSLAERSVETAKAHYEQLFLKEEREERERRMNAYNHCTY